MGCCSSEHTQKYKDIFKKINLQWSAINDNDLKTQISLLEMSVENSKMSAPFKFDECDNDGSGHLDKNELKSYLNSTFTELGIDHQITDEFLDDYLAEYDLDQNQNIGKDEFCKSYEDYLKFIYQSMVNESKRRGLKL
jgi:hypothetical protein